VSTASFETGPLLVSDLPPAPTMPGFLEVLRARFAEVRGRRAFERAIRFAGPNEQADLYAQARRA
jgi:hypothetical protein